MSKLRVAIDTNVLIWGVRKQGPEASLRKARILFEELDEKDAQIIVPAVALAEFLVPVDKDKRSAVVSAASERFEVMPFDARCVALAAELFRANKALYADGSEGRRDVLKSDTLIVATAKSHGAKILYTDDDICRQMASEIMEAHRLPEVGGLFD